MSDESRGDQPPALDDGTGSVSCSYMDEIFPAAETTLDDARRTYVKIHYERFAGLFARCDAVGGMRLSFGLAPFLFGGLWFLYRKIYLEGLLLLAVSLSLSAYEVYFMTNEAHSPPLLTLFQFSLAVLAGLYGGSIYWKATDRQIEKAMRHYPGQPDQALAWLDSTGGVNLPMVVLALIFKLVFCGAALAVSIGGVTI